MFIFSFDKEIDIVAYNILGQYQQETSALLISDFHGISYSVKAVLNFEVTRVFILTHGCNHQKYFKL